MITTGPASGSAAARTVLILSLPAVLLVLVVLALVLQRSVRGSSDPGSAAQAPGKLPDLWKAENYDEVIAAADSVLRGDPLNATALSYRGFA